MTVQKLRLIFSRYVAEGRTRKGMTQQRLAERVSKSLRWVQKVESGKFMPSLPLAVELVFVLEIDVGALFGELYREWSKGEDREEEPVPGPRR